MLADELAISGSTLHQAITTLVQSGLLISRRGRAGGTFVTDSPPLAPADEPLLGHDAWAVPEYRVAIETGATMLGSERAEADDLDRLGALVERMWDVDQFEAYRRADIRFHVGLAEAARSPRLVSAMTEVQGRMSGLITHLPHPPELLTHSNAQQGRLVPLLRERDTTRAVRLMRGASRGPSTSWPGSSDD